MFFFPSYFGVPITHFQFSTPKWQQKQQTLNLVSVSAHTLRQKCKNIRKKVQQWLLKEKKTQLHIIIQWYTASPFHAVLGHLKELFLQPVHYNQKHTRVAPASINGDRKVDKKVHSSSLSCLSEHPFLLPFISLRAALIPPV